MSGNRSLGRLNVAGGTPRPRPRGPGRATAWFRRLTFSGIAAVVCLCLIWAGKVAAEQLVPQRVVVRGCWLTDAEEVLASVGFNGMQSVAEIRRASHSIDLTGARWIRRIRLKQDSLATALMTVEERTPLLLLKVNGDQYWLCDDGEAIPRDLELDTGEVFATILTLPVIELETTDLSRLADLTTPALQTAALCHETLPGVIRRISVAASGELDLYDHKGFRIRLGQPTMLEEKIAALPKALRICEQKGSALQYLDARDPQVFYEKWKEPISN